MNILLKKEKNSIFDEKILNLINHPFYNFGGIFCDFNKLLNYILNLNKISEKFNENKNNNFELNYSNSLKFFNINSNKDLILPFLIKSLKLKNIQISSKEISSFNKLLLNEYYSNSLLKIIYILIKINKNFPLEIISKFWIRCFTLKNSFEFDLNNSLINNNKIEKFKPFFKIIYKGLELKSLKNYNSNFLYKFQFIKKEEIEILNKNDNKKILFFKCFLFFTKNIKIAMKNFIEKNDENLIPVLFIR
jgi:hypothetical protein